MRGYVKKIVKINSLKCGVSAAALAVIIVATGMQTTSSVIQEAVGASSVVTAGDTGWD